MASSPWSLNLFLQDVVVVDNDDGIDHNDAGNDRQDEFRYHQQSNEDVPMLRPYEDVDDNDGNNDVPIPLASPSFEVKAISYSNNKGKGHDHNSNNNNNGDSGDMEESSISTLDTRSVGAYAQQAAAAQQAQEAAHDHHHQQQQAQLHLHENRSTDSNNIKSNSHNNPPSWLQQSSSPLPSLPGSPHLVWSCTTQQQQSEQQQQQQQQNVVVAASSSPAQRSSSHSRSNNMMKWYSASPRNEQRLSSPPRLWSPPSLSMSQNQTPLPQQQQQETPAPVMYSPRRRLLLSPGRMLWSPKHKTENHHNINNNVVDAWEQASNHCGPPAVGNGVGYHYPTKSSRNLKVLSTSRTQHYVLANVESQDNDTATIESSSMINTCWWHGTTPHRQPPKSYKEQQEQLERRRRRRRWVAIVTLVGLVATALTLLVAFIPSRKQQQTTLPPSNSNGNNSNNNNSNQGTGGELTLDFTMAPIMATAAATMEPTLLPSAASTVVHIDENEHGNSDSENLVGEVENNNHTSTSTKTTCPNNDYTKDPIHEQDLQECGLFAMAYEYSRREDTISDNNKVSEDNDFGGGGATTTSLPTALSKLLRLSDLGAQCPCSAQTVQLHRTNEQDDLQQDNGDINNSAMTEVQVCGSFGTHGLQAYRAYCQEAFPFLVLTNTSNTTDETSRDDTYTRLVFALQYAKLSQRLRQIHRQQDEMTVADMQQGIASALIEFETVVLYLDQVLIFQPQQPPTHSPCLEGCAVFVRDACCGDNPH